MFNTTKTIRECSSAYRYGFANKLNELRPSYRVAASVGCAAIVFPLAACLAGPILGGVFALSVGLAVSHFFTNIVATLFAPDPIHEDSDINVLTKVGGFFSKGLTVAAAKKAGENCAKEFVNELDEALVDGIDECCRA